MTTSGYIAMTIMTTTMMGKGGVGYERRGHFCVLDIANGI